MESRKPISEWLTGQQLDFEALLAASRLERKVLLAIVQGRYTPSPAQRQAIAGALQVRVEDIIWGHTAEVSHLYGHGPQFGRTP